MSHLRTNALLSLIFADGFRPSPADLIEHGNRDIEQGFAVTHQDADSIPFICAELLISGLAFDCHGLAPGPAVPDQLAQVQDPALLGLDSYPSGESVSLAPGQHIAAGAALPPVVQGLVALGASLVQLPQIRAVCWHPAGSVMEPGYFRVVARDWINGGVFPALGLVSFHTDPNGELRTRGLHFFTGQELALQARLGLSVRAMAQLAIRLVDRLVVCGKLNEPERIEIAGMNDVLAIPDAQQRWLSIGPVRREW